MFRKSIYKKYTPAITPDKENNKPKYWFIFLASEMLIKNKKHDKIPFISNIEEINLSPVRIQYLGLLKGNPCYSVELESGTDAPEGMVFKDLKLLYDELGEDIFLLAGKAFQIVNWDKNHQFCGRCGTSTENDKNEMAKICPECGFTSHTRLSPAVITAIIKDGKILMAKHLRTHGNTYGLIAGFVEPGETIEETVKRETMEEVGIKVKNIKYFGSQPWPFPDSLMIAFTAEYDSGDIKVDGKEIVEAQWFTARKLPRMPHKMSIAGELMEWYVNKYP
ncbi:MAG: NAD(+) diphosphatase [Methanobacterium sp.]|nr:NAD(+) diphosphatase [Methanobacterium sp.]